MMKVLLTVASVARSHGGPARSVTLLAHHLARHGVQAGLWAADGSSIDPPLLPRGSSVCRLGGSIAEALEAFPGVEVIHDNGLWLPFHHQLAKWSTRHDVRRIVSPRGMLEPWAMRYKRGRKMLAWWIYQKRDLATADTFHATSGQELRGIQGRWPRHPVVVIPNGVDLPPAADKTAGPHDGMRTAVFLGRLHPVKGLPMLLEAWARVRPDGWRLRIAGPDEDGYRERIERDIGRFRLGREVALCGELDDEAKAEMLDHSDLFILPSHTENFGIAVAEAMAHALPVITTQGTPWQAVQEQGCGWWVPANVDGLAGALADATSRDIVELSAMGRSGRAMAAERFSWDVIARRFIECYNAS
jgi:glycosyltransferase involved in cell wall biosynthesis